MTLIIAEAGVNHNGDFDAALKLADAAKEAGADIVKFQTFLPDKLVRRSDPSYDAIRDMALSYSQFLRLASHCRDIGIEFMSTPGELDSLRFLVEECGVARIKIGSDDLTYAPLVRAAYASKLPVILSTGMATLIEIRDAMPPPWIDVSLLHCVSLYPCFDHEANLRALDTLSDEFQCPVGYSDHTAGIHVPLIAVACGAEIIEKHIMISGSCPDVAVSVTPTRFAMMVEEIRDIEEMLGDGIKAPCKRERENIPVFRKQADGLRGAA